MEKQNKEAITELLNKYEQALNASDVDAVLSLYTKDGLFLPTAAPAAQGIENVKKAYEFVFSTIKLKIKFLIQEIVAEDEIAFAVTTSKGFVNVLPSTEDLPEENRELFVFEKENGEWKIARYMFNKAQ